MNAPDRRPTTFPHGHYGKVVLAIIAVFTFTFGAAHSYYFFALIGFALFFWALNSRSR